MSTTQDLCRYVPETHQYFRGNVELPSITTILKAVWPRDDQAPADKIEGARLRGEFVDKAFTEFLKTGEVTLPAGTRQDWSDCVGQCVDWWQAERAGAKVESQVVLFGEREAGTADLIVDGCEILELKSTWEISCTVPAQLGGYGDLREYSEGLPHPGGIKCGVLHCHKRLKKASFKAIDYVTAWDQWRTVRNFYRLTKGIK